MAGAGCSLEAPKLPVGTGQFWRKWPLSAVHNGRLAPVSTEGHRLSRCWLRDLYRIAAMQSDPRLRDPIALLTVATAARTGKNWSIVVGIPCLHLDASCLRFRKPIYADKARWSQELHEASTRPRRKRLQTQIRLADGMLRLLDQLPILDVKTR